MTMLHLRDLSNVVVEMAIRNEEILSTFGKEKSVKSRVFRVRGSHSRKKGLRRVELPKKENLIL